MFPFQKEFIVCCNLVICNKARKGKNLCSHFELVQVLSPTSTLQLVKDINVFLYRNTFLLAVRLLAAQIFQTEKIFIAR